MRLLATGAGSSPGHPEELPDEMGFLVEARSAYRIVISDAPRFVFKKTKDDDWLKEKLADIHQMVLPLLIQELPKLSHVKWAVGKTDSELQPDCRLLVELTDLYYPPGVNSYVPGLGVVVNVVVQRMSGGKSGLDIHQQTLQISYDFTLEQDERIREQRLLDRFYEKIAQEIGKELDRFLSEQSYQKGIK